MIRDDVEQKITELNSIVTSREVPPRAMLILTFVDNQPIVAGSGTSGDGILLMAGATNVFAEVEGWKPISRELLIGARPDHIVLTERALKTIGGNAGLSADPILAATAAISDNNVHPFAGMRLLGFGLQTLDVAVSLKNKLHPMK